ncbi:MAG: bestrophin family protein [Taibaiella sp.]|jgi:putative membrane protein
MIVYESNKNWLRDVSHLYKSWTMQKVMRSTLYVAIATAIISLFYKEVFEWKGGKLDITIFSLLGVVLSILLSFRTNSAYDRWWEGRKKWGELVNNSRNLAIYLHSCLPPENEESRHYLAVRISNFALALKEHLRMGTQIDEFILVSAEEIEQYNKKAHIPNFIAYEIVQCIQNAHHAGYLSTADHINIKQHSQELLNISGACERIKKTPIPFSYNVYLKLFITFYAIGLPFALIPVFGYWSILIVAFVFFAFIGLELMAEEIEDPFGLDCNDLPTGDIAHTIRNNVFEILEVRECAKEKPQEMYSKVF